jgi:hypothetical protein
LQIADRKLQMKAHAALLLLLPLATGCRTWQYSPWGYPQPPQVLEQASTRDMVVAAVNKNAQGVHSLKTTQATLSVSGVPTSLPVDIALERPQRFRMRAEKLMMNQLDVGSNDDLFWFWVRLDPSGRMYYCRHADMAASPAGAGGLLPISPDRMGEAFGLAAFEHGDEISNPEPVGKGRLRIRSVRQTPHGGQTKITVIDDRTAMVLEQHLYDAAGNKLVSVLTSEHQQDAASGAWLPRKIDIHSTFQGQPMELSIEIDGLEVNTLSAANARLWEKPQYPGAEDFNLCGGASGTYAPPQMQQQPMQPGAGNFYPTGGFAAPSRLEDPSALPQQSPGQVRYNDPLSVDAKGVQPTSAVPTAAKGEASRTGQRFVPWRRPQ